MAKLAGFLGPSYQTASPQAACEKTLNLYSEVFEVDGEPSIGFLKGSPGLSAALATLPTSPVRGLWAGGAPLSNNDRLFAVAGSKLYELDRFGAIVGSNNRGDVGNDGYPVQIFPNGLQLFIVSAGQAYVDPGGVANGANAVPVTIPNPKTALNNLCNTEDFTFGALNLHLVTRVSGDDKFDNSMAGQHILINAVDHIVDSVNSPDSLLLTTSAGVQAGVLWSGTYAQILSARTGAFLSSFFIAALDNSKSLYISAQNDGTQWDAADIATKESYPDNIGSILADHQELIVFGESHSEVWGPGSDPTAFPFQPIESFAMAIGIAAPWSASSFRDGPVWIGASLRGKPIAYFAKGFIPQRISTHAIEQAWAAMEPAYLAAGVPLGFDAQCFVYEMDGHEFWQVSFPIGDQTWVYDRTASEQFGKPMWHERGSSDDGITFHRHRASCHAFSFDKHWVGDYSTGAIYEMSSSIYQDAGATIYCQRVFPHINHERLRQFYQRLQVDLETGVGAGTALTVLVEWSNDGGTTWTGGGAQFTYTSSTLKAMERANFPNLGSDEGSRVFKLTISGNFRKALLNAYLDMAAGIS